MTKNNEFNAAASGLIGSGLAMSFDLMRSLQDEPAADILRYEKTGGDPARGQEPDIEDKSVLNCPCLKLTRAHPGLDVEEFTDDLGRLRKGLVCLGFKVELKRTDAVRYPAGDGERYEVAALEHDPLAGEWWILGRRAG